MKAKEVITEFLKERGLTLSPEKTRIAHIDEGFDFLGWNFRKYKGKLLIKPAEKNVLNHIRKIRKIIKESATARQRDLIGRLNPIIKGWAHYHASQVSKKIFKKMDCLTWRNSGSGHGDDTQIKVSDGSRADTFTAKEPVTGYLG